MEATRTDIQPKTNEVRWQKHLKTVKLEIFIEWR